MKVKLYNQSAEEIGNVELPERIFGLTLNDDLVHQALVSQISNSRQVLAHAKDRSEVRGGGIKPWRQKGTGRARHGSSRSPIWRGGGATFGPTSIRNFKKKINRKMKQKALFMALSSKIKDKKYLVVDDIKLEKPKTREVNNIIDTLSSKLNEYKKSKNKRDKILIILPENDAIKRTIGNLVYADIINAKSLNLRDILSSKYLLLLKESIPVIDQMYKFNSQRGTVNN